MPYATSPEDGIRIYYEVVGNGPPVAFMHGFTISSRSWHDFGYVDALKDDFQLILIDARGHGQSDKPHRPDRYGEDIKMSDVLAVLDACGINNAHFCGYSMGARYGYALALHAASRLRSLIAMGSGFGSRSLPKNSALNFEQGMQAWVDAIDDPDDPLPAELRHVMLANDPQALRANTLTSNPAPDRTATLATARVPAMVVAGTDDGNYDELVRAAETLPEAGLVVIDAIGHFGYLIRSDLILPHIRTFLERVERERAD